MNIPPDAHPPEPPGIPPLTEHEVFQAWWPLAASWLLMGLEMPTVSAVVARLPEATVSLAAYGGVVMPLSLLIEAPIIMLLAASTALARDLSSYRVGMRFMWTASLSLTALHVLIAFTPLYDLIVVGLLRPPSEVVEPARVGLRIMTPWTLAIAYRRYQQGVLIRFGRSRAVSVGTAVRLATIALTLTVGAALSKAMGLPAIVVGAGATALGVVAEAVFAWLSVRPLLAGPVRNARDDGRPLDLSRFLHFYIPLSLTPLIMFAAMPLSTAAMGRMPTPLESLAAWPAINGLVLAVRSTGFALNEVVVSLLDRPGAAAVLQRFAGHVALTTGGLLLALAATPLGGLWFGGVSGLTGLPAALAVSGLWFALPIPASTAFQSFHQGAIVHGRATRHVTESVIVLLATIAVVLGAGIALDRMPGLHVALGATALGNLAQLAWLARRSRDVLARGA